MPKPKDNKSLYRKIPDHLHKTRPNRKRGLTRRDPVKFFTTPNPEHNFKAQLLAVAAKLR